MTELARHDQAQAPARRQPTLKDLVDSASFRSKVSQVLPKHLTPDRFVRIALLAMNRTPKLAECTPESLLSALMTLSQYGLEPDGRRAHLIPFKRNFKDSRGAWQSQMEVQLIIDYKGLAELVMRSGLVSFIHADIVCDADEFDFDAGELKHHRVNYRNPRGKMYATYARIRFKDGSEKCDVMSRDEIDAIRARSKSKDNGPWVTDYNEMAKKTVFRRASKWLSLSPEYRDAIEHEDEREPIEVTADTGVEAAVVNRRLESMAKARESLPEGDDQGGVVEQPEPTQAPSGAAEGQTGSPPRSGRPGPKMTAPASPAAPEALQEHSPMEEVLPEAEKFIAALDPGEVRAFLDTVPAGILKKAMEIANTNLDEKASAGEVRACATNAKAMMILANGDASPPSTSQTAPQTAPDDREAAIELEVDNFIKREKPKTRGLEKAAQKFPSPAAWKQACEQLSFQGSVTGRKDEELEPLLRLAKRIELTK